MTIKRTENPSPGTYHEVESQSQPLSAVLMAPLEGLYEAIDIAAFILMVGGFLGVMAKTAPWTPVSPILSAS